MSLSIRVRTLHEDLLAQACRLPERRPPLHAGAVRLRPQLDEAGRAEVALESERFGEPAASNSSETRGIDEGIRPLVMPLEPIPCLTLDRLADVLDGQARRA